MPGHPPKYFPWRFHGGRDEALDAAKRWRDDHWNGESPRERFAERNEEIRNLVARGMPRRFVAQAYRISPQRVSQIVRADGAALTEGERDG